MEQEVLQEIGCVGVKERLKTIKKIIAERDEHVEDDGHVEDYMKYDEHVYKLNDDGHIDWLVEQVEQLLQENETLLQGIQATKVHLRKKDEQIEELKEEGA